MALSEADRLAALRDLRVLEAPPSDRFDRITRLAADLFEAPMALVTLIDDENQLVQSSLGCDVRSTPRRHAFCAHALELTPEQVLVVEDSLLDERFRDNPMVLGPPGIRFYAGAPLTLSNGAVLGALCVLDTTPRPRPSDRELRRLTALAAVVVEGFETARLHRADAEMRRLLELGERIAGVGHWRYDLRSGVVTWSDEVYRIHGVDPESFNPNLKAGVDFYHPEDRKAVEAFLEHVRSTGEEGRFQLRLIRADGELREVVSRARREDGADGQPAAIVGVFQDVTSSAQALAAAKRNERRYRLLADNMADVVTRLRADGSSSYISPAVERLLGWTPAEMAGRTALDFVHADDRPALARALRAVVAEGGERNVQLRALRRDGGEVWAEVSLRAVAGDGEEIIAVIRDVSARRALEAAVADSERLYRLMADRSTDTIARIGLDARFRYVSPAVERLSGYTPEELIGRETLPLIHPEDREAVNRAYGKLVRFGRDASPQLVQYRLRRKSGEYVWVEVAPTLVYDAEGAPLEFVDVTRDISERKAAELELIEARRLAEVAALAKTEFLANMSHELRTPLTSIIGFAGVLAANGGLDERQARWVERIRVSSQALLAIINDVLDYSKLEAGSVDVDPAPFRLSELAQESLSIVSHLAESKGLALTATLEPGLANERLGDAARLRQVLLNLLGNAVKFTTDGEVELSLAGAGPDRVRFEVRDTGVGVSPEARGRLFDRFSQADASVSRNYGGTGLGLAISRQLVGLMDGDIGVEPREGGGSVFWFHVRLPVATADAPAIVAPTADAPLVVRSVLVADDTEANRELLGTFLTAYGLEVSTVTDGVEAVRATRARRYDLILMDLHMPVMDGVQAIREIRASPGYEAGTVPIYGVTASENAALLAQASEAGMTGRLGKPIDFAALRRVLTGAEPEAASAAA
jgi:PAS domain S-box-containing protein